MQDNGKDARTSDAKSTPSPAKKPYQAPRILEYGTVAKLTQSSSSASADTMNTAMACL